MMASATTAAGPRASRPLLCSAVADAGGTPPVPGGNSIARGWLSFFGAQDADKRLAAVGVFGDAAADCAAYVWASWSGWFAARIVADERISGGAPAPRFRWAMEDEPGVAAVVLPVWGGTLESFPFAPAEEATAQIEALASDLVALPVHGGRALSLTGMTAAVMGGDDDQARVAVFGTGRGWLDHQLARVRRATTDMPTRIAVRETAAAGTLILAPAAFDWSGVIPPTKYPLFGGGVKDLVIADSSDLANALSAAMKAPARRAERPKLFVTTGCS